MTNDPIVEIKFGLPYSLNVDGVFSVTAAGEQFEVSLSTKKTEEPNFPGAASVENIAISNDDTDILAHTDVSARYTPKTVDALDQDKYSGEVPHVALAIANTLVTAARIALGDFMKDYLFLPKRLGPIDFVVQGSGRKPRYEGRYDPLMGGITAAAAALHLDRKSEFGRIVQAGKPLPIAKELYFDGRRYLVHGNCRMALANLVMGFEVGLADSLALIARSRGNSQLEAEIFEASLGTLGQEFAKQTLGHSFERQSYWGARFYEAYNWLREARNSVLHKARLTVTRGSETRDFSDKNMLETLVFEHDWLRGEIDQAVSNVLARKQAKIT